MNDEKETRKAIPAFSLRDGSVTELQFGDLCILKDNGDNHITLSFRRGYEPIGRGGDKEKKYILPSNNLDEAVIIMYCAVHILLNKKIITKERENNIIVLELC